MEITRKIYQPRSGFELTYIQIGERFIQENLLHPVESEAVFRAFKDSSTEEELEILLDTRLIGVKTINELLESLYLSKDDVEEGVLNFPVKANSKIAVYSLSKSASTIIPLNPDYSNYEITCTMYNSLGVPVLSSVGGKVVVYGKSFISDYFTQMQNGIFYTETPDSTCIVSVALKEMDVVPMDIPAEIDSFKIRVRMYNE